MKINKIIAILFLGAFTAFTACNRNNGTPKGDVEIKQESEYTEKDSIKTDPTEGKGEGDLGESMPPGTR